MEFRIEIVSFQYACFISYRRHPRTKAYVDRLASALKEELEMLLIGEHNKVFRDNDYLRYGDDVEDEIAQAICKSVCLLIVYVPNTYEVDHPYCAREYAAMCELEKYRLQNLGQVLRPEVGPILTLPFRGEEGTMPAALANRGTYEYGAFRDLSNEADLQHLPAKIATDIANWCDLFAKKTMQPADGSCDGFPLPGADSEKSKEIIEQQQSCGLQFPNRSV